MDPETIRIVAAAAAAFVGGVALAWVTNRWRQASVRADRRREWNLQRIADTEGAVVLEADGLLAQARGDDEQIGIVRELQLRRTYPQNDIRLLGKDGAQVLDWMIELSMTKDVLRAMRLHGQIKETAFRRILEQREVVERGLDPVTIEIDATKVTHYRPPVEL